MRYSKPGNIIFLWICLLSTFIFTNEGQGQDIGQQRASLEKQRNQLQLDIERVSQGLKEVQKSRHQTITQLGVLQNRLELRNKLIRNINKEIGLINSEINKAEKDVQERQAKLDTLKAEYAKMVVYAYKNRDNKNMLYFLLSADSFNDAIKRFQYLKQYQEFRQHESNKIQESQEQLKLKIDTLNNMKADRGKALSSAEGQRKEIVGERNVKDSIAKTLKIDEKKLLKDIQDKKKKSVELSDRIAVIIRQQIEEARRRAAEEARRAALERAQRAAAGEKTEESESESEENTAAASKEEDSEAATSSKDILEATPEAKALSKSFEANMGKLPWPVSRAFITETFGVHAHPILSKVTVDNDGITLQTAKDAVVRAVFNGEVVAARPISGRWMVVIQHGKYFTVYANMQTATVAMGEKVGTGQPIGLAYTNTTTGVTELNFKVYNSTQPVDPLIWLAGK